MVWFVPSPWASTDGLTHRGMEVFGHRPSNLCLVGKKTWDVSSVWKIPSTDAPFAEDAERQPIHKKAPTFDELSTSSEAETGSRLSTFCLT